MQGKDIVDEEDSNIFPIPWYTDYSSVEVEKEVINVNTPDDLAKANILCKERIL
ncbi:MAG: hypothetical protein K1T65_00955 [Candidatus Aramenus sp.]|nr:hypothetical protein [Candidatus Aramenus sp.]